LVQTPLQRQTFQKPAALTEKNNAKQDLFPRFGYILSSTFAGLKPAQKHAFSDSWAISGTVAARWSTTLVIKLTPEG
jgi:hypothetical protein